MFLYIYYYFITTSNQVKKNCGNIYVFPTIIHDNYFIIYIYYYYIIFFLFHSKKEREREIERDKNFRKNQKYKIGKVIK
jgi:hypothetical protein